MISGYHSKKPGKAFQFLIAFAFLIGCSNNQSKDLVTEQKQISAILDSFNIAAAKADYNKYFSYFTEDAIFTGTDATERWNKQAYMIWAKPYFDKGTTWDFTAFERHIYFDQTGNTAWFDELLSTQMKICRGSGVLVKNNNQWKIQQYILSATIPNDMLDSVIKIKASIEDSLTRQLRH
jgi:ketosteroid isomerase-like protein